MSELTVIKYKDVVIKQQDVLVLKDVNIEIEQGEFIFLIGKVGSGKSSFLKTLYSELPLFSGQAVVDGFSLRHIKRKDLPSLRLKCGIIFQDFRLLSDRNVYDNLAFVLKATGWKDKESIKERINDVLTKTDMINKGYKMPHELSGGEQQRIVIARALLNSPDIIIADEPTGNLDPETSFNLLELLRKISDLGKTVIFATHQYDLIKKRPARVLRCEKETISEIENVDDSLEKYYKNSY